MTLDLSRFGASAPGASVTPGGDQRRRRTGPRHARQGEGRSATVTVPAKSVTTLLVDGGRGIAEDAALVQPGHVYRLQGAQSGKSLAPSADGKRRRHPYGRPGRHVTAVVRKQLTSGDGNRERYALVNAGSGRRLAVRDNEAVLEDTGTPVTKAAQWIMSTTGDGTWTFVNAATGRLLDVVGQATADGARVSAFLPDLQREPAVGRDRRDGAAYTAGQGVHRPRPYARTARDRDARLPGRCPGIAPRAVGTALRVTVAQARNGTGAGPGDRRARPERPRRSGRHRGHHRLDPPGPRQDLHGRTPRPARPPSSASDGTAEPPTSRSPGTPHPTERSTTQGW